MSLFPRQAPTARPTPQELALASARGSFWTATHFATAIPLAFVANALVARMLGPADYGQLAVLSLCLTIATVVANGGTNDATVQWGAAAHSRGDREGVDRLLGQSLGFRLLVQWPLLSLATLAVAHTLPWQAQVMLLASVAVSAALGSASLCVVIENLTARHARLSMATNVAVQASIVLAAWLSPTAVSVWAARTTSGTLQYPTAVAVISPRRRRAILHAHLPRHMPPGFWRYSALTAATVIILTLVSNRIEVFALKAFVDPDLVGVYAVAFGTAIQLRAPIDAFFMPFVPHMTGILATHEDLAAVTLDRALRVNGLLAGALLMLVPPAAILLPVVFGRDYALAVHYLPALAVVATGQALVNPLLATAQARRQGTALLLANSIALMIDVAVAVAAVRLWSVWGAVAATAAAQLVQALILVGLQQRVGLVSWRTVARAAWPYLAASSLIVTSGILAPGVTDSPRTGLALGAVIVLVWWRVVRGTVSPASADAVASYIAGLPRPIRRVATALTSALLTPSRARSAAPVGEETSTDHAPS